MIKKKLPRKLKKAWRKKILNNLNKADQNYERLVFDRYRGWTLYPPKREVTTL